MKGSIILLSGWLLFAVLLAGSLTRSHTSRRRWFRLLSYPRIPTSRHLPRSPQHEPNFLSNLLRPPCRFYFRMAAFYRWMNALPICARANDPSMDRIKLTAFTLLMSLLCAGSFWIGRRAFARREGKL